MILPVSVAAAAVLIASLAFVRIRIGRDPEREGGGDSDDARDYNSVNWLPPFWYIRRIVLSSLGKHSSGIALDAGCGPGYLVADIARRFPKLEIIGLDISGDMLAHARSRALPDGKHSLFCRGDVQSLPLKDGCLELVVSTLSLHHWPDAGKALAEIYRVLKPGGRFLILDVKRDMPVLFFIALWLFQVVSPASIRKANGPIGSVWSSYTADEIRLLLGDTRFEWDLRVSSGWMLVRGRKSESPRPSVV